MVQIIGFSAWTIIAFAIHQRPAVPGLRDEYDAQLQVLLRNSQGADSTSWSIFSLVRTSQGRKDASRNSGGVPRHCRCWQLFYMLLFLLRVCLSVRYGHVNKGCYASIDARQIATNSYDHSNVLIQPGACGSLKSPNTTKGIIGANNLNINISSIAKQYARSCYGGGAGVSNRTHTSSTTTCTNRHFA